ncbi:hypothetical protein SLEP1_g60390, partial [Rubroshorea leprosula]
MVVGLSARQEWLVLLPMRLGGIRGVLLREKGGCSGVRGRLRLVCWAREGARSWWTWWWHGWFLSG